MELAVLGIVGFWALIGIALVLLVALVNSERPGWATITLLATLGLLQWLATGFKPFTLMYQNPWWAFGILGGYFAVGALWCFGKWYFFVSRIREEVEDRKGAFLRRHKIEGKTVPDEFMDLWADDLQRVRELDTSQGGTWVPRISDHKGRVLIWLCHWPWSMLWTLIDEPVKRLFKAVYRAIKGSLQAIADHAFRKLKADLPDSDKINAAAKARAARERGGSVKDEKPDDHADGW
jgi:hypothetical protein